MASAAIRPAIAQTRGIGAGALVLDDNHTHTLIFQTPQPGDPGYNAWAATGPLFLRFPIPPVSGANMGFVAPGPQTTLGGTQVLVWNAPDSGGGTGGAQGEWVAEPLSSLGVSGGAITGSGSVGHLAGFISADSVGNVNLSGDVTTSGGTATTISSTGAAGVTAGTHIVAAINSDASTGAVDAVNGGTGQTNYTAGDLLIANSATSLARLPVGTSDQVLGVSGGSPAWVTNGATITNATNTSYVKTDQDNFTLMPSSTYIRISDTNAGSIDITGINSAGIADGRMITIANVSSSGTETITITDHNAGSAPNNQFDLPGGQPIVLGLKGAATFIYDEALQKWELVSTN